MPLTALPDNLKPAVEKALEAKLDRLYSIPLADVSLDVRQEMLDDLEDDCLAFLNACLEAGEAREAKAYCNHPDGGWLYSTFNEGSDFFVLILRMGDKS